MWECELGIGFAAPVTQWRQTLPADRFDDNIRLTARDAKTGKFLWKYEYATEYEDIYGYDPRSRVSARSSMAIASTCLSDPMACCVA